MQTCSQMNDCDSVVIAEHNILSDIFTCVLVRDIVEEMVKNPNSQYTVYHDVDAKRSFGKRRIKKPAT